MKRINPMKSWRPKGKEKDNFIYTQEDKPYYKTVGGKKARLYKVSAVGIDDDVIDIAPKGNYKAMKKIMQSKVLKFIESDEFDSMSSGEKASFLKDNLVESINKNIILMGNLVNDTISGSEFEKLAIKNGYEYSDEYLKRKGYDLDSFSWGYYKNDDDFDKSISGDNSYNSNLISPVTNINIYKNKHTGELIGNVCFHLGGDIRGNYSKGIVIEGIDEDDIFMTWVEEFTSSMLCASIYFTDGSVLNVDFDSHGYLENIMGDFGIAKFFENTDKELIGYLIY